MYAKSKLGDPVVQKYGGTSMGTPERIRNIAKRVAEQYRGGWGKIAIVVSAMSGETNRLVALVREVNPHSSAKAYDMAVASGEQVSIALLVAALEAEGIRAEPFMALQLGILTDEFHSKARIKSINAERIGEAWSKGFVPVVAGFQGMTSTMDLTTLGRGGSDTSAVALAVALNASFCEINTDVDGVFTCDPRIVPSARLIPHMDFESAMEMAQLGSKVLHPRCVELGAKWNMPIVVRNTFTPNDHRRTCIMNLDPRDYKNLEAPLVSGITLDRDVARIEVSHFPAESSLISKIFRTISEASVNVDIIVHNRPESADTQMSLGFTTTRSDLEAAIAAVKRACPGAHVHTQQNLAKVSVVGVGMSSHPGVASATFAALTSSNIEINMISTSEIKISCVIDAAKADEACRVLHREFIDSVQIPNA